MGTAGRQSRQVRSLVISKGHFPSFKYLCKFKIKEGSNLCSCGTGIENAYHLLLDCPLFNRSRSILRDACGDLLIWANVLKHPDALDDFIFEIRKKWISDSRSWINNWTIMHD